MSNRERLIHLLLVAIISVCSSIVVANEMAVSTFDNLIYKVEHNASVVSKVVSDIRDISSKFAEHLDTARGNTDDRSRQLHKLQREQQINRQLIIKLLKERPE